MDRIVVVGSCTISIDEHCIYTLLSIILKHLTRDHTIYLTFCYWILQFESQERNVYILMKSRCNSFSDHHHGEQAIKYVLD